MAQEAEDYEDPLQEFLKNHPDDEDEPEQKEEPKQDEPEPEEEESAGDKTEVEPEPEVKDEPEQKEEPAPDQDDWKKSEVFSEMDKMSHGFRKRIEKLNQKHQSEMDELKNGYEARIKALEERTAPKPEVKGRDAFTQDEDYIQYLVQQGIEADRAERAKADQERSAREEQERAQREAQEADIRRRQDLFRTNTENSFDAEGKARFMGQVQYAMEHGFGDVLDNNPAASDYLLGNRMGPKVLDHILNHTDEFKAVFMNQGQSQMDQYYELKKIEDRVLAEGRGEAEQDENGMPRAKVRLGKPGGQGSQARGAVVDDDPRAREDYLRKLGIC